MSSRREALTKLGLLGGGALLGLGAGAAAGQAAAEQRVWRYHPLEPHAIADLAYRVFPEGGCMYAMVRSVVGTLADAHGEPYRSFPYDMMRFGEGGVGGWGSLCGVVNGAAALAGLFYGGREQKEREALIQAFGQWYQETALPRYVPAGPAVPGPVAASVAGSVICHLSLANWREASGQSLFGPAKRERCRRLTADGAGRMVELLNESLGGVASATVATGTQGCLTCHGKGGEGDAFGRMDCEPCHTMPDPHP